MNDIDQAILEGQLVLLQEENETLRGERDCFEALWKAAKQGWIDECDGVWIPDDDEEGDDNSDSWKQGLT